MPRAIVTSIYRYKCPPRKTKPQAITGPVIVVGKRSRRLDKATAAAEVFSRSPRHHDGTVQPSTLRKTEREPAVTAPPPANDDRKSAIVTTSKRGRRPKLAQLAQFEGDFANFDGSPASQINGLAAVCGLIGGVVATKAIPFCRRV